MSRVLIDLNPDPDSGGALWSPPYAVIAHDVEQNLIELSSTLEVDRAPFGNNASMVFIEDDGTMWTAPLTMIHRRPVTHGEYVAAVSYRPEGRKPVESLEGISLSD